MRPTVVLTLAAAFAVTSPAAVRAADVHSVAQPDRVVVTHASLDFAVDFERKVLDGTVELTLDWKDPGAHELVLDTRELSIATVKSSDAKGAWHDAKFALGTADAILGTPLVITVDGQPKAVRIAYHTAPTASGLQWLSPEQTMGKKNPFMFSQSQAIHARSWVPLQDTPAVRFTYDAHVTVPKGLRAAMSADNDPKADGKDGFRFRMPQKIPSYLLAVAVGDLRFAPLGKRTGVYAEPERIEAAAKELEDTERMVEAAEKLYGPYRWGRYDILVLPPSFPFGGMENPRLTFATPTILAGDKSLTSLVAHELAHSWSGNLVTNADWTHAWLNEGFTVYVENRILGAVYGPEVAAMNRAVEQNELITEMKELEPALQWLEPSLKGRDPDDNFTGVPYTKGSWLLSTIESRVGRPTFDKFLRGWFDSHAFQSADTATFVAYLRQNLLRDHPDAMSDAELEAWLHQPGIPASAKPERSARFAAVDAARERFVAGKTDAKGLGAAKWTTYEWVHFLNVFGEGKPDPKQMAALDAEYGLTARGNSEIAFRWLLASIRADYQPARPALEKFLLSIGRRKFVVPLWTAWVNAPGQRDAALALYQRAKPGYHPLTQGSVEKVLAAPAKPAT